MVQVSGAGQGKQTRAQQGLYNGTLPFGYMLGENRVPVPHPFYAEGLVMAFKAYSTGRFTDTQIAELLNREGYRTTGNWGERLFTKDTVNRMLRNVFYLGHVKYRGEVLPGQHPALVDQELFDKCQEVRGRRASKRRSFGQQHRVYLLSGLARCHECKLTLRCTSTQSRGAHRYYRHTAQARGYECPVPGKMVRAEVLEDEWTDIVSRIQLPEDWRRRIEELAGDADQRQRVLRERDEVQEKLRRLRLMYRDLMIDDVEYRSTYNQLQSRLSSLVLPNSPHIVRAGEYLEHLGQLWVEATPEEQRDITRVVLKAVYVDVLAGAIVAIEPTVVFRTLFTAFCDDIGVKVL